MLERYGFPYGDRTELWDHIEKLEKTVSTLTFKNNAFRWHMHEVKEELHEQHIKTLLPIVKDVGLMTLMRYPVSKVADQNALPYAMKG